ncbi:GNAT family N-acetyltransferase [Granulicella tundricola]|uniref:GCN5-related N-acetyltransferase n=1 Tax=Granulicella tundricola (strain ATCC BAA-1859 / DSM 23138 / MP5ACTX9) TaxID=1198114 RepID=E8X4A9_GRATM|nr:GNAT family N-acetyltransferase [Granulicella tundricola]ADW68236.1 GCN5-related N-acetyltransferase [Granulicella tundricola MP5ACTX9]
MIRVGTEGDLEAIVRLEREITTAPHWGIGEYEGIVRGDGVRRCLYVADAGGVVGFAVGKVVVDEGEVESIAVRETSRGCGVGGRLLTEVLEWCREAGAGVVDLEVRAGSEGAGRLYRAAGFVEIGRRRGYYSGPVEDAVLMRVTFDRTPEGLDRGGGADFERIV